MNKNPGSDSTANTGDVIKRAWYRFKSNPLSIIGGFIVIVIIIAAIFAPYIAPYPDHARKYTNFEEMFQPPDRTHFFGTDEVGRDTFTRVMYGYRISLFMVLVVLGISTPIGVFLGLTAGYFGGILETIIMRPNLSDSAG